MEISREKGNWAGLIHNRCNEYFRSLYHFKFVQPVEWMVKDLLLLVLQFKNATLG